MIGIICARGNSKRLPKKNTLEICGKPLIQWSIEAAQQSRLEDIYVSTEDVEIADISKQLGAKVVIRPDHLSQDNARHNDIILHCLSALDVQPDSFCNLQATSPLRNSKHINEAIALFEERNGSFLISVRTDHIFYWALRKTDDDVLVPFFPNEVMNQTNPVAYVPNGALYICKTVEFIVANGFPYLANETIPYVMDEVDSIDINYLHEFRLAELYLSDRLRLCC